MRIAAKTSAAAAAHKVLLISNATLLDKLLYNLLFVTVRTVGPNKKLKCREDSGYYYTRHPRHLWEPQDDPARYA
jgi:hypothetical protein